MILHCGKHCFYYFEKLAGHRKSLLQVFQDRIFHPKMAMVIDDRMKVWDDKDQLRVHVVPPFAPYYAPQAEVFMFTDQERLFT